MLPARFRKLVFAAARALLAFAVASLSSPQSEPQRAPAASVADGFTLAAVGDIILPRPVSPADPDFAAATRILKEADVAFGNLEGTAFDLRRFLASPQAESGGAWIRASPETVQDLKTMGFRLLARANNHATDWGPEGMRATNRLLDEAGLVHAGTGDDLAAARAPSYLETSRGRLALVSMTSTFTPMSRAGAPLHQAPGRPGVSALRTTRLVLLPREAMETLRQLRSSQPGGSFAPSPRPPRDDELEVFGVRYRLSDHRGLSFEMHEADRRAILKSIRQGRQNSNFLLATIHAHEPGNRSETPADFLPTLARQAIDAGADAFIGHGPHQLRGIEIYKGRPIFYSLGNFFFQTHLTEPVPHDMYEQMRMDPAATTDAELNEARWKRSFSDEIWHQSVIAVSRYAQGELAEIRLYPVDLGRSLDGARRGVPRLASPALARVILERLDRLSRPYGAHLAIEGPVGVIRPRKPPTSAP